MKNTFKAVCFTLILVLGFSTAACSDSGGGKIVNSAEALKEYLDSQPANSPDKPIKVVMNANNLEFEDITAAIISSLKYVSLDLSGSPITAIPDGAFLDRDTFDIATMEGCTGLIGIVLPNRATSIGDYAFVGCTGLKSITIPNSVNSIGDLAFAFCTGLTAINVANNNTVYSSQGGVLYNKDKTALLAYPGGKTGAFTIPNSVKSIGDAAFGAITNLKSITISNSVTRIGDYAFQKCTGLISVTIGNGVTSIGDNAFDDCENLTSVTFQGTITSDNLSDGDRFGFTFPGDLRTKYLAGGPGTYTRPSGSDTWTKR
jgi:hypothetical protein